jgi:hypothetical protein
MARFVNESFCDFLRAAIHSFCVPEREPAHGWPPIYSGQDDVCRDDGFDPPVMQDSNSGRRSNLAQKITGRSPYIF